MMELFSSLMVMVLKLLKDKNMAKKEFIKPSSKGLIVRDPISWNVLPENGDNVPMTTYWKRRVLDGSVVIVKKAIKIESKMESKKYENKSVKNTGERK